MSEIPLFLKYAFLAGAMLGIMLSLLSFFVVIHNWSFLGVGISHAAFGGVALGFLLHIPPDMPALLFALAAGVGIGLIKRSSGLSEDTAIGVIFSSSMGLGVILFSLSKGFISDAFSYLFGNILAITGTDLFLIFITCVVVLSFVLLFLKGLLLMAMNEELAYVRGLPVHFLYYSLLILLSLSVVLAIKLVGVILVTALIVVPASIASRFFVGYRGIMIFSLLIGLFINLVGLAISYMTDLPPGATMALLAGLLFTLSLAKGTPMI